MELPEGMLEDALRITFNGIPVQSTMVGTGAAPTQAESCQVINDQRENQPDQDIRSPIEYPKCIESSFNLIRGQLQGFHRPKVRL